MENVFLITIYIYCVQVMNSKKGDTGIYLQNNNTYKYRNTVKHLENNITQNSHALETQIAILNNLNTSEDSPLFIEEYARQSNNLQSPIDLSNLEVLHTRINGFCERLSKHEDNENKFLEVLDSRINILNTKMTLIKPSRRLEINLTGTFTEILRQYKFISEADMIKNNKLQEMCYPIKDGSCLCLFEISSNPLQNLPILNLELFQIWCEIATNICVLLEDFREYLIIYEKHIRFEINHLCLEINTTLKKIDEQYGSKSSFKISKKPVQIKSKQIRN